MKKLQWTDWARERLLPLPGETWTLTADLKKAEKAVLKAGGGQVPAAPTVKEEVQRAVSLRVHERYNPQGNYPRDTCGRDLVDVWCARRGVAFATEVLIAVCRQPREKANHRAYELRLDGQPWGRLREHLAVADAKERKAALALAATARKADKKSELPAALAYAFCEQAWVKEALPRALDKGYGQLALLTALTDKKKLREALVFLLGETEEYVAKYQLVEYLYPHMPTVLQLLDDADAPMVVRAGEQAWNKATRKPWLEIVGCLQTPAAKAFVKKYA